LEDGRTSADWSHLDRWVEELSIRKVLVVGEPDDELVGSLTTMPLETRFSASPLLARRAVNRLVAFRPYSRLDEWVLLIAPQATAGAASTWTWSSLAAADPLSEVFDVFEMCWPTATTVRGLALFVEGDLVRRSGTTERGRVRSVRRAGEGFECTVSMNGRLQTLPEHSLELEEKDPESPEFWLSGHVHGAEQLARTLTWTKLRHPLTDVIYSYRSSRTVFRAYQFKPVLKIMGSDRRRLLIADEVGLGKTIEAGLVWNELEQRGDVRSALVVCPSSLRFKWQAELRLRFDRRVDILDRGMIRAWRADLESGEGRDFQGIASLELLRSLDEDLDALASLAPRLDLVIVDEAHYMRNAESKSHGLGELLAEWADALLFLSATPLNLHQDDLFNLLHLLDANAFPSAELLREQVEPNKVINATARLLLRDRDTPRVARQRLQELPRSVFGRILAESPDYRMLLDALDRQGRLPDRELVGVKRRLTELHTLAAVFTRTRKVDTAEGKAVREPRDIVVNWTGPEQAAYEAVLAASAAKAETAGVPAGFAMQMPLRQAASCLPVAVERVLGNTFASWTDEAEPLVERVDSHLDVSIAAIAGLRGVDTKYDMFLAALLEALRVGSGQALIFSFFKGTLEYLLQRLGADLPSDMRVDIMYGPTPVLDREVVMRDFRSGRITVLLCSEVGSEGLDFQFCNVLFNYDLPWNPMRIEQRIGRIDRFGQTSEKIFIFNMQVPGTIESDILGRLYHRIGVFEQTIGDLEPILRDLEKDLDAALDPRLSSADRRLRVEQVALALENRHEDVAELQNADGLMNGIGDLLVDGFDEDSPGRGRYVGRTEVLGLVRSFLAEIGGELRPIVGGEWSYVLTGSAELARLLRRQQARPHTTMRPAQLAAVLEDPGLKLAFAESEAVAHGLPLVNVQHPLVIAAVEHFGHDAVDLSRFCAVRLPDLPVPGPLMVGVYLVEELGLRPSLEMMCLAVDDKGRVVDGVEEALLINLAEGRLEAGEADCGLDPVTWFGHVERHRAARLQFRSQEGQAENDALIDRQMAARRREFELKIDRAQATLAKVESEGRAESIVRMNRSRVKNLCLRRDEAVAELDARRAFSVSSSPVAVVLVTA
jgi:superfamily II DNA or RNA helicase